MHQHLSTQTGPPAWAQGSPADTPVPRRHLTQHDSHMHPLATAVPNGHWVSQRTPAGLDDRARLQQPALGKAPETTAMTTGIHPDPMAQEAWQSQLLAQLQAQCHFKPRLEDGTAPTSSSINGLYPPSDPQWQGYNCASQVELVSNGLCFPNGRAAHTQTARGVEAHMEYSMAEGADGQYHLNSGVVGGTGQCHAMMLPALASAYQTGGQKQEIQQAPPQQPKPPSSTCFPQYQAQTPSLEHLLGLSQTQHLPHLDGYGVISSGMAQDPSRCSKVRPQDTTVTVTVTIII